jgi:hypothetical protein
LKWSDWAIEAFERRFLAEPDPQRKMDKASKQTKDKERCRFIKTETPYQQKKAFQFYHFKDEGRVY